MRRVLAVVVGAGIALVLRQEDPHGPTRDRHEQRETRLEAVLPVPGEAQPRIPGQGGLGIACAKDRRDLLVHNTIVADEGADDADARHSLMPLLAR